MSEQNIDRGDSLESTSDESSEIDDQEVKGELEEKIEEGETTVEVKDPVIPKKRFDQAVGKARKEAEAASKRAEEAEAKLKAQQGDINAEAIEGEIDDLFDKADQAQADGNKELLKSIRREIREKQQLLADARAEVRAAYKAAQAIEQIRYDAVVDNVARDHPELDEEGDDFDQEVSDEVMELYSAFVAKGEGSAAALKKAVKVYYKGTPTREEKAGDNIDRKEAAVKKGLEAKGQQPATKKAGLDSDKGGKKEKILDPSKINDKDWAQLSKEEKAAMRGDTL